MPNIIYRVFYEKFDHTNYENRTFSDKPKLDFQNLGNYPKLYETYFNDHIPFRNELVQLKNIVDIFVFHNIISDDVLLGNNNWLFPKLNNIIEGLYIGKDSFTDIESSNFLNSIIDFRDKLKNKNIDFIFMVCPDKSSVYNEYMPNYIRQNTTNYVYQFVNYIKENSDIKIVYPIEELIKYKYKYQLYYKYDTHWNQLGAYIGYLELMKYFHKNIHYDISYSNILIKRNNFSYDFTILENSSNLLRNDMARYLSLSKYEYFKNDVLYIPDISNSKFIYTYRNIGNNFYFKTKSESNNKNRILVIRDSFALAMVDYISPNFEHVEYIHVDSFKKDILYTNNIDIVIFETVERLLKQKLLYVIPYLDL